MLDRTLTRWADWSGARLPDLAWSAGLACVGTVEMLTQGYRPYAASVGTYVLASAATCLRRQRPLFVLFAVLVAFAAAPIAGFDVSQPASWMLVFAMASFAAGRYLPSSARPIGLLAVVGLLVGVMATLAALTDFSPDAVFGVAGTAGPWVLGVAVREAEDRAAALAISNEREQAARASAAERSSRHERARIAREIHDILAHSLSLMVVQAEVAENVGERDPAAAKAAAREVQSAGRAALAEVGHLVRIIRKDGDPDEVDDLCHVGIDLAAVVRALADDVARAGLPVTVEIMEATPPTSPALRLTVYRIVQEALTNALRHAPGAEARVRLGRRGDFLEVCVSNGPARVRPPAREFGGYGLAGLQERVALFAGSLQYGPSEHGGFRLQALLPYTEGAP